MFIVHGIEMVTNDGHLSTSRKCTLPFSFYQCYTEERLVYSSLIYLAMNHSSFHSGDLINFSFAHYTMIHTVWEGNYLNGAFKTADKIRFIYSKKT